GDLVGIDVQAHLDGEDGLWRWREDGVATATESVLNIGTMFAPSGGGANAALRTGTSGARLLRIVTGSLDLVLPGTSAATYGSIRFYTGLRTALHRLDDAPSGHPNGGGAVVQALEGADAHTIPVETPVSDEL